VGEQVATPGVADTAREVAAGRLSARAATEAALARIREHDPRLRAFSEVLDDAALVEADRRDAARAGGDALGPLHGVPVAIKAELDVAGVVTTFGGEANTTPAAADAEVVRRLRAAGAVVVGTTTMPEFGAFPYTESASRGLTRNPWDPTRSPGGSSGGSAAAVAAGLVPVAMGGDGGGSIRIPSAFCGLFGLKPQRGRVTTAPHAHLWWALGTSGPLTRSVRDAAVVHDVIDGSLPSDRFRAGPLRGGGTLAQAADRDPGRLRVGWSTRPVARGVRPDPTVVRAVQETAALLRDLGHDVVEVHPRYPDPTAAFVPQFFAGIRAEAALVEHPERLERRTRETCRLGAWATPWVAERAVAASERVSERANRVFDDVDVLLTPAVAHRPPRLGVLDGLGTVAASWRALPAIAYAALWNVAGNPAASVPCGPAADGLPVSVQLVGRTDDEPTLVSLSAQIEAARPWPLVAPAR